MGTELLLFTEFTIIVLMLALVKCYDNKMVKATPHLFHPFIDSALRSKPTTKKKYNVTLFKDYGIDL